MSSSFAGVTDLNHVKWIPKPKAGEPALTATVVAKVTQTTAHPAPALSDTLAPSTAKVTPARNLAPQVDRNAFDTFQLPKLSLKDQTAPKSFNAAILSAAIQCGCSIDAISAYLESYDHVTIRTEINAPVEGLCTALFYAIERNDTQCVTLLLQHGANPTIPSFQMPALGFAIINGKQSLSNPLDVIKTLLAYGADAKAIPFVKPSTAGWKAACISAMNISQEFFIHRAKVIPKTNMRTKQLARAHGMTELLNLPYFLIGQSHATTLIKDNVVSYVTLEGREPLVMAFSGPSGHGKTELAQQMGKLLSVDTTVVDCAQMKHDTDLFGARNGYQRSDEGSQLNNFLAENDGKCSVVFLDEFDKTSKEILHSLLLVCGSGAYYDRRNNTRVDCSKTLWILATNLGDKEIERFYNEHMKKKPEEERETIYEIRGLFTKKFGAPFTGRINVVVPFLPFNETECAIVTHKFLLDFVDEVRQDIEIRPDVKRYVGHCHFDIGDGTDLVRHIAKTSYTPELGARSLRQAVNNVKLKFILAYLNDDGGKLITDETNESPLQRFVPRLITHSGGSKEIVVLAEPLKCKPVLDSDSSQGSTTVSMTDSDDSDDDVIMPLRF
ncbi:uncharacterized protein K452DRAFT_323839 [Aplosporella prunicola CBS 121167]|uniref:AAA+ ATPase domain-containing protein n=1 Tax=Aplosporella prunicola CBS 121167 TaxID=1176127 RepID=A0A6A6BV80_9PEZI|nr:uncharacterized protein K452DRAFT_323839 [Aplosporella prunicola CBS 121167]KAF2146737.1 hypothetical protein K452DRAFT_323839 [Aplosporella prunicola CBS 121167]